MLLRTDGHVCLTDFGLAKMGVTQSSEGASSFCGTVEYMAPEMVAEQRSERSYGQAVDLWALGVLLYQLLTGDVPFVASNQKELLRKIRAAKPKFPTHTSGPAKAVLRALLAVPPDERIGLQALQGHAFFASLDWAAVLAKAHPPPFLPCADALERSAQASTPTGTAGKGKGKGKGGEGGAKTGTPQPPPALCLSPSPSHEPLPDEFASALSALRFSYEGPASAWRLPRGSPPQPQPQHAHTPLARLRLPGPAVGSPCPGGSGGPSFSQQLAALALGTASGRGGAAAEGGAADGSAPADDRPAADSERGAAGGAQAGLLGGPAKGAHARASVKSLSVAINVSCAN